MIYTTSREDMETIYAIVARAQRLMNWQLDRLAMHMDISVTHANGCPLKLKELSTAPDADFLHDIAGISRHLDRKTGTLGGLFTPRYAVMQ